MANRRARRSQRRSGPRPNQAAPRRAGLRLLVLVAVVGLVLLALASFGAVSLPVPTPSPII